MKFKKLMHLTTVLVASASLLVGCSNKLTTENKSADSSLTTSQSVNSNIGGITAKQKQQLANLKFENGTYGYVSINGNRSTLNPNSWKTNKVIYQNLDSLNRTSASNTGFLEKRNLANGSLRERQTIQPTGWHYNSRSGEQLYNRGHLIAYSVSAGIDLNGKYNPNNQSGDQNNPKNLFTQTAYANQQLQTIFEKKIRTALRQNKKVIYQATPIFKGNNKFANGINLQAISTDKTLNFNVYIFNVQPGYSFDLATGRAKKDNFVKVKALPASLQSHYNNSNRSNNYRSNRNRQRNYYGYDRNSTEREATRDFDKFSRRSIHDTEDYLKHKWNKGKSYWEKGKEWYYQQRDENDKKDYR